ncbi:transposase [Streptomyces sp. NPDC096311]|uniref:transposase n=1 Tax=Streptomyces sp. NPDC096311 TaxID=3366083 RepID=UPI0038159013
MLDTARYVVDNGVKWANPPADFPPFRRVHAFGRRWQVTGLLTELHDRLRDKIRQMEGRSPDPTGAIVDSQSLRAAATPRPAVDSACPPGPLPTPAPTQSAADGMSTTRR